MASAIQLVGGPALIWESTLRAPEAVREGAGGDGGGGQSVGKGGGDGDAASATAAASTPMQVEGVEDEDYLAGMLRSTRERVQRTAAMVAAVGPEMMERMDTGVRVNPACLAWAQQQSSAAAVVSDSSDSD